MPPFPDYLRLCVVGIFRFEYAAKLQRRISESAKVIPVLDDVVMQGWPGAVGRASLPPYSGTVSGCRAVTIIT